jgi:di/tricarboxylate transporter
MTLEIAVVLGLPVLAMVLFATKWLSVDVVALGLVAALIGVGIVTPSKAFDGFGSKIIGMVLLLILVPCSWV